MKNTSPFILLWPSGCSRNKKKSDPSSVRRQVSQEGQDYFGVKNEKLGPENAYL